MILTFSSTLFSDRLIFSALRSRFFTSLRSLSCEIEIKTISQYIILPGFWLFAAGLFWSCSKAAWFAHADCLEFVCWIDSDGFVSVGLLVLCDQIGGGEHISFSGHSQMWSEGGLPPVAGSLPWSCWRSAWRDETLLLEQRRTFASLFLGGMDWQGGEELGLSSFRVLWPRSRKVENKNGLNSRLAAVTK